MALSQVSHEGFAHRRSVVMCSQTICGDVLIVSELHSVRFSKIWICSLSILLAGQPLNWSSGQIRLWVGCGSAVDLLLVTLVKPPWGMHYIVIIAETI